MNRSVALQKRQPGQHIFEYETGIMGHQCDLGTFDYLMMGLIQQNDRHYHEVVYPGEPLRLLLDCDKKHPVGSPVDEADYVARVTEIVRVATRIPNLPPPEILVTPQEDKFSVHLLWEVVCTNPHHADAVAREVAKEGIYGVETDLWYPLNRSTKTMRMPFCSKLKNGIICFPRNGPKTFTPSVFVKNLITFFRHDSTMWELPPLPPILLDVSHLFELKMVRGPGVVIEGEAPGVDAVLEWLELSTANFEPSKMTSYEDGRFECTSSFLCAYQNRLHTSNRSYIHISPDGVIDTVCMAEPCRRAAILPFTRDQILVSKTPPVIDWAIIDAYYKIKS
jgi:hypothetical protein